MTLSKYLNQSFLLCRNVLILLSFLLGQSAFAFKEDDRSSVIIKYHHVSNETPFLTSISPEAFEAHMLHLSEMDFDVIPITELIKRIKERKMVRRKTAVITFDDAYKSVYETAWPILKRYGYPFSVYVNAESVSLGQKHSMTWEQIKEMSDAGVQFANHTYTHLHMIRKQEGESEQQWLERLDSEIDRTDALIFENTGQKLNVLAYPFGEYNMELKAFLKDKDYVALAQHSGAVAEHSDLQALPRFPFGGHYTDLDDFKLKVASLALPVIHTRLGDGADISMSSQVKEQDVALFKFDRTGWVFDHDEAKPSIYMSVEMTLSQAKRLACYVTGQGRVESTLILSEQEHRKVKGVISNISTLLPIGRSRINCTLPSKWSGRYYWYSQPFIRKDIGNQWYSE